MATRYVDWSSGTPTVARKHVNRLFRSIGFKHPSKWSHSIVRLRMSRLPLYREAAEDILDKDSAEAEILREILSDSADKIQVV